MTDRPEEAITIELWPGGESQRYRARVVADGWHPIGKSGQADLALLRTEPGGEAVSLPEAPMRMAGASAERTFQCLGFPTGYKLRGQHAAGVMRGHFGPNGEWFQLDGETANGYRIREGFSGTPVWDVDNRAIVGIVVAEDKLTPGNTAAMIPTDVIARYLPQVGVFIAPPAELAWRLSQLTSQPSLSSQLPRVNEVDRLLAGVTPTRYDLLPDGSPYVSRDVDGAIAKAISAQTALLLRGPSKSGKSRSAFQAVSTHCSGFVFVVPKSRQALGHLLEDDVSEAIGDRAVIWLDEFQLYLPTVSDDGLTGAFLESIASRRPQWRVVGTLRDDQHYKILASGEESKNALATLNSRLLTQVSLAKELSPVELVEAQLKFPDEDFNGGVGIGERLVAGPQLLAKLRSMENPLGWALVQGAVDWSRTGAEGPVNAKALGALARHHLANRFPILAYDTLDWAAAISWATTPVSSHVPLLTPTATASGIGFRPFDYVVTAMDEPVAGQAVAGLAWSLAADQAGGSELSQIIETAVRRDDWVGLQLAAQKGRNTFSDPAEVARCALLAGTASRAQGDAASAVEPVQYATQHGDEVVRAHAWAELGRIKGRLGELDEARSAYEAAIASGHDHTVAQALLGLGELQESGGNDDEAIATYLRAAALLDDTVAAMAWARLAVIRERKGEQREAGKAMEECAARSRDPRKIARALVVAGHKYRSAECLEAALAAYRAAAETAGSEAPEISSEARFFEGTLATDYDTKEQAYRAAIRLGTESGDQAAINLAAMLPESDPERLDLLEKASRSHNRRAAALAMVALSQTYLSKGEKKRGEENLSKAKILFGENPAAEDAYYLGQASKLLGNLSDARLAFQRAVETLTADSHVIGEAQFALARTLLEQGDVARARETLAALEQSADREVRARAKLLLAELLVEEGKYLESIDVVRSATDSRSWIGLQARRLLAGSLAKLGNIGACLETLKPDLENPDTIASSHTYEWLGILYAENQMWRQALEAYESVLEMDHTHSVANAGFSAGQILEDHPEVLQDGNDLSKETERVYRRAFQAHEGQWSGLAAWRLSILLDKSARTAEAIEILASAGTGHKPGVMCRIAFQLGILSIKQGKRRRALALFQQALDYADSAQDAEFVGVAGRNLALLALPKEDVARGERALERVLKSGSRDHAAQAGIDLATWHLTRGDAEAARRELESVIAIDTTRTTTAWLLLSGILLEQGAVDEAIAGYSQAQKSSDPKVAAVAGINRAYTVFSRDQSVDAVKTIEHATLAPDPEVAATAWYLLALVRLAEDNPADARQALANAKRTSNHVISHEAAMQLAGLLIDESPEKALEEYIQVAESNAACKHVAIAAAAASDLVDPKDRPRRRKLLKIAASGPVPEVSCSAELFLAGMDLNEKKWHAAEIRLRGLITRATAAELQAARTALGYVLVQQDNQVEAGVLLKEGLAATDTWVRDLAALGLGDLKLREKDIDGAQRLLLNASDSDDSGTAEQARLLLARAHLSKGDLAKAIAAYEELLNSDDEDVRSQAKSAIAEIDG